MSSTTTRRPDHELLMQVGIFTAFLAGAGPALADCPIQAEDFKADPAFTSAFASKSCDWRAAGANQFMIIQPGYQIVLASDEERQVITVLDRTKVVAGVTTRVIEELSSELDDAGEWVPVERSLNYFARCRQTNSIFYFGEDVQFLDEDGNIIGSEGTWLAGRNGAKPGIVMPGQVLIGGSYYEEVAPEDSALDKARIVALERGCEVGDRTLSRQCVTIEATSDCEPGAEEKVWAAGIGTVIDDDLELVSHGFVKNDDARKCIKLLGEEVLPAVREIGKELGLWSPFEANAPVSLAFPEPALPAGARA